MEIKNQLLDTMLKIRAAEEKIVSVYAKEQSMRTPTHLSIGQEAVAAGLMHALESSDQVFAGHRCHAAYLAKGGNLNGFFAELCGRSGGISQGRSGSAHLTDPSVNIYSSPILGAMIPVAVGAALSFQMDHKKFVAVTISGDATVEEGVFAESVNFAVAKKLPVLFVCENNLYSTHSPLNVRQPASPIFERVRMPELQTTQIDGNDVELVYKTMSTVIAQIRSSQIPQFVECLTYRVREHVGPLFDYDRGYRSKEEVDAWIKNCPIERFVQKLIKEKLMTRDDVSQMRLKWDKICDDAYAQALSSPWPSPENLLEDVY